MLTQEEAGHDRVPDEVYRVAFERSAVGICVIAPSGRYLYANPSFCELVGYSQNELRLLDATSLIHPGDLVRSTQLRDRMLRGETSQARLERRFVHKSGLSLWALITTTLVRDATGGPAYFVSQVIDITDRRLAEDALQRAEARFRALISAMQDVILVLDRDGTYVDIAPSATHRLFRAPSELLGRRLHDVFDRERADEFLSRIHQALESQRPVDFTYSLSVGDEQVWFEATVTALPEDRVVWVARDVTARYQAEQRLRESEDQLRQSQKMEAVGQLAGGIAHDFNNLLMAILSNAELATLELPPDSPTLTNLEEIRKASRRARELTQQLLAFSRKQVLQPRLLDLNAVVRDAEHLLRRLIGETINLAVAPGPDLLPVRADQGQLVQVLVNLCVNARDAMPGGGQLTIETANVALGDAEAKTHRGLRPGEYVMLQVRDTGVGMDAATLGHIFEPFFTTKPPGEGTGLGLSMVYGIVKQSGGYIAAESQPGSGTTFCVYLPGMRGAAPDGAVAPASASTTVVLPPDVRARTPAGTDVRTSGRLTSAGDSAPTVLLVEDEAAVREAARRMLAKYGYSVIEAKNGRDALLLWEQHARRVDLLLTDVVMPTMGGAQLAEALRQRRPSLRVVFMSGYTQGALELESLDTSATRFLPKPFTSDQLIGTIRELLPV